MTRWLATMAVLACAGACGGGNSGPETSEQAAPGTETTNRTAALETGANLLQSKGPVEQISYYLVGFHPSKADPTMQMEAHHYCNQMTEDVAQCVLFDGNTDDARMIGIEYIVSAATYDGLPDEEKAYWHPHNFEILSGQLRMPGLPDAVEKQAMTTKMNSYGKTWHTWMSGGPGRAGDPLPYGPAHLQWSFNRDGEADAELVEARDKRMGLDTAEARAQRRDLVQLARPQGGVSALAGAFPKATLPEGVSDNGDASTRAVPVIEMRPPAAASRDGDQAPPSPGG